MYNIILLENEKAYIHIVKAILVVTLI